MAHLNFGETLSCIDGRGRIRCPSCGKYRSKITQMRKGAVVRGPDVRVHFYPTCDLCDPDGEPVTLPPPDPNLPRLDIRSDAVPGG